VGPQKIAGTTHKTVRRVIARHDAGGAAPARVPRGRNYDGVATLVAERVSKTSGRISAKRLLPTARAAGYGGSDRSFRRLVAEQKRLWRRDHHRGRRPAVWSPGEHLVIDWGTLAGLHVFCVVLAWSRFRFAADERAATTLSMLAECFEVAGGVPGKVLADRMGCLKGGGRSLPRDSPGDRKPGAAGRGRRLRPRGKDGLREDPAADRRGRWAACCRPAPGDGRRPRQRQRPRSGPAGVRPRPDGQGSRRVAPGRAALRRTTGG
jgi:hypothetical protein